VRLAAFIPTNFLTHFSIHSNNSKPANICRGYYKNNISLKCFTNGLLYSRSQQRSPRWQTYITMTTSHYVYRNKHGRPQNPRTFLVFCCHFAFDAREVKLQLKFVAFSRSPHYLWQNSYRFEREAETNLHCLDNVTSTLSNVDHQVCQYHLLSMFVQNTACD